MQLNIFSLVLSNPQLTIFLHIFFNNYQSCFNSARLRIEVFILRSTFNQRQQGMYVNYAEYRVISCMNIFLIVHHTSLNTYVISLQNTTRFYVFSKVIYPKYSKHWPYTVAHTIDCSKMLNHGLNHGLLL